MTTAPGPGADVDVVALEAQIRKLIGNRGLVFNCVIDFSGRIIYPADGGIGVLVLGSSQILGPASVVPLQDHDAAAGLLDLKVAPDDGGEVEPAK